MACTNHKSKAFYGASPSFWENISRTAVLVSPEKHIQVVKHGTKHLRSHNNTHQWLSCLVQPFLYHADIRYLKYPQSIQVFQVSFVHKKFHDPSQVMLPVLFSGAAPRERLSRGCRSLEARTTLNFQTDKNRTLGSHKHKTIWETSSRLRDFLEPVWHGLHSHHWQHWCFRYIRTCLIIQPFQKTMISVTYDLWFSWQFNFDMNQTLADGLHKAQIQGILWCQSFFLGEYLEDGCLGISWKAHPSGQARNKTPPITQ